MRAGEDRHVLEHRLAALTEPGRLDRDGGERPADLVDDQRRERLALDVLCDDEQRARRLHDLLEHRDQVVDRGDLRVDEQDVRVLEDRLLALGVGDEVRGQVALVELHALGELQLDAEGVGLLDGHGAVLADLVDRIGDHVADRGVGGGDGRDLRDLLLVAFSMALACFAMSATATLTALSMPRLSAGRAGAGSDVAQALVDQRLGEHGRGRGPVTRDVVRLGRDLLHQLRAHVLERVLELDLAWRSRRRRS